jgi:hypothetical protein
MDSTRTFTRGSNPLTGKAAEPFKRAVNAHLPGRTVWAVRDRGEWLRRIVEVTLDGDEAVFFKLDLPHEDPGWLRGKEGESHERDVARIFERHRLHGVPPVLVVDHSCEIISHPYVIQAGVGGTRLGDLLDQESESDVTAIYETVGDFYRRLHGIHNDRPGLWIGSTPDRPWGDPPGYMYRAEIVEGSGQCALEQGRITQRTYDRAVGLWGENLGYINDFQPTLIHYSPFLWNIYLQRDNDGWHITKLTSLGDVMWWEPAYDIACLRYPPFGDMRPSWWEAFLRGYGPEPECKRVLLYAVMQRLCAAMGSYWEPESSRNKAWATQALDDLDRVLDEIERL